MTTSRMREGLTPLLVLLAALGLMLTPVGSSSALARRQEQRVYGGPGPGVPRPDPQAGAAKWERYSFPGDEFSVELPGMPFVFHTQRGIGPHFDESERVRVFGHYDGGVIFMVVAFDRPRPQETPELLAAHFLGGAFGAATKEVAAGDFRGKEYRGSRGAARLYTTRQRVYLVNASSHWEKHPPAERFLDSFTLSAGPQGRVITEAVAPPPGPVAPPAPPRPFIMAPQARPPGIGLGENPRPGGGLAPWPTRPPGDDPSSVFRAKDVTHKAVIVYKGDPGFTEEARRNNVNGVVRLRAVLSSTGRVTNVSIIKVLPDGLTERAVYAARHILFFPAVKDGRAVSQYVTLEYNFNVY